MTPKEKAQDIFDKMYHKLKETKAIFLEYKSDKNSAKQCALIAIDEMLDIKNGLFYNDNSLAFQYLNEVKQEIEKL